MKYIIDSGHGERTPGKRSPEIGEGIGIYEWEFNREVAETLCWLLDSSAINLTPGPIWTSLDDRVDYINWRAKKEEVALVSIHANAAPGSGWSNANGLVVFHSRKASKASKNMAASVERSMRVGLNGKLRSRGIKQANHKITTKTACPAILVECGFMTNRKDAAYMASENGRDEIAAMIAEGVR
jgi:N-acetylmuramoyl-L-alanine amidase